MIDKAESYPWSSANAHCGLDDNSLLTDIPEDKRLISKRDWSSWLALPEDEMHLKILRRNADKGLPCGNDAFIDVLEKYQALR